MGLYRRVPAGLVVAMAVCVAGTSCMPAGPAKSQIVGSGTQPEKGPLSNKQITRIANATVRQRGWNPRKCDVSYKRASVFWRTRPNKPPELEGHDYEVVMYRPKGILFDGGLICVSIDRNTGEVLEVYEEPR